MKIKLLIVLVLLSCAGTVSATQCSGTGLDVLVLGSGGPELTDQRASTSYLVRVDSTGRVLIDTGTGSALRFEQSGENFGDIQAIAFTHLHVDHSQDLPAFVKGSYFVNRDTNLAVLGPSGQGDYPGVVEFLDALFGTGRGAWRYLDDYLEPELESAWKLLPQEVDINGAGITVSVGELTLTAVPVHHGPVPALAWRVDGAGSSVVFSGDTSGTGDGLIRLAEGADLLVAHNAVPEGAEPAALNLHMSPTRIANIAREAGVRKLALSHFMRRSLADQEQTLKVIRELYAGEVAFVRAMDCLYPAVMAAPERLTPEEE
jgi:ribonuclease BN (tRNA processing enzyme)